MPEKRARSYVWPRKNNAKQFCCYKVFSEKNGHMISVCYLPAGRSVLVNTVSEVFSRARGSRPRAVLKNEGTVFPNTDRLRPANNMFIFFSLENYFIRNICVDFLLKQFHTVCVRLTFRSSKPVLFTKVFKIRDSVFAYFRTEQ